MSKVMPISTKKEQLEEVEAINPGMVDYV